MEKRSKLSYFLEFFVVLTSILLAFGLERYYESYLDEKYLDELIIDVRDELVYDYNQSTARLAYTAQRVKGLDNFFGHKEFSDLRFLYDLPVFSVMVSRGFYDEWIKFNEEIPEKYDSLNTLMLQIKNRYAWTFLNIITQREDLTSDYKRYLRERNWFLKIGREGRLSEEGKAFILNDITLNNFLTEYQQLTYRLNATLFEFRG